ncbi:hypothetical protein FisN_22Lh016 [Fistulifera solaris]|uniref:Uncharacterized protein n=1 Tax=Fistulifera solaris TaxID=1519565 RepID=A0A1Z5JBL8_FISSO|nr:hypothetical protein FisN_22Lh016 [Fistulifera solaris]|eukprot:GAX11346.1 hypothetical protein FisN_22Lh016 [Fistulifera solaris]
MAFAIPANPMNRLREKGEFLSWSAHAREINLRSILVRTVSWRRSKKLEDESGDVKTEDDSVDVDTNDNATKQTTIDHTLSSVDNTVNWECSLIKTAKISFHSSSSDESFADDDSLAFGWSFDDLSDEESDQKTKLSLRENDLYPKQNESDDNKDNLFDQARPRTSRDLKRQTSRRRRKQSRGQSYSLSSALDLYASFDSLDSVSSRDELLDTTSDSLELGSSRHSVGRCARRRAMHNRHLHQLPRHRQHSFSTSSDPSANYSRKSALQKRIDNNLKAQSQHSVSSRGNPRYLVVTSDSSGQDTLNGNQGSLREARSKEQPVTVEKTDQTYPRFILVESDPRDDHERGDRQRSRRGRRRRSITGEKSHSV